MEIKQERFILTEKYVGTKHIEAAEMDITDAEKYLGRDIKPSKSEYSGEGYLVRYEDGYESWSPKEVFDKVYRKEGTYIDRMRIELDDLKDKIEKMDKFLQLKDKFLLISERNLKLMKEQLETMKTYEKILANRMECDLRLKKDVTGYESSDNNS